ncbi:Extradiol ring-cleavage dioxygenase, class III enzyme, subunit B [Dioszegia hungarica]|uniref:Extradiol ring-cleavage dioxygenase, class III enzyme, subunit B n=1 Tax=Dioszegia hungarica TaxID=4972 RepID=A0AA38H4Y8_9TREE|nr:Extradiol ring-cleavage dioxygenase, class III enzyme, subunit B [Dioszegia hungarica]KAI9634060.1 Extradiol ring-cleavage dioxygenase, class III enzyme, subunit B [Dioszegia hungarica]
MSAPAVYKRGEVYFLSHGGPPSMFDTRSEPYQAWRAFGQAVEAAKPRGLIVVSAHWENPSDTAGVQVNNDPTNPLIYDFYGFPKHYYRETFTSHGSAEMLDDVVSALGAGKVPVEQVSRGADHGLWVPLKVAFNGKTSIPIIQVSLPGNSSPDSAAKLGKALSGLRGKGYTIIGSGQIVHNLRDAFSGAPTPYTEPYLAATDSAIHSSSPVKAALGLFKHEHYKRAHPTPEHLLPLLVPVAAADEKDKVEALYVGVDKMGLGWGMWRWVPQEQ